VLRPLRRQLRGAGGIVAHTFGWAQEMQKQAGMETITRSRITPLDWVSIILVVIGALNWGLVGLFEFDLVAAIFGPSTVLSRIVYVLVAVAGVYLLVTTSTRSNGRSSLGAA
jgi:uncharacterized membrane protein YuzA (DUF378 family)